MEIGSKHLVRRTRIPDISIQCVSDLVITTIALTNTPVLEPCSTYVVIFLVAFNFDVQAVEGIECHGVMQKVNARCASAETKDSEWFLCDRRLAQQMF